VRHHLHTDMVTKQGISKFPHQLRTRHACVKPGKSCERIVNSACLPPRLPILPRSTLHLKPYFGRYGVGLFSQLNQLVSFATGCIERYGCADSNNWHIHGGSHGYRKLHRRFSSYFLPFHQCGFASLSRCPSYFALFSGFVRQMFVPNARLERRIASKTRRGTFSTLTSRQRSRVLGVQIRRGDKGPEAGNVLFTVEQFARQIEYQSKLHGLEAVYLMTNGKTVLTQLRSLLPSSIPIVAYSYANR
jgi:hypothetical protein